MSRAKQYADSDNISIERAKGEIARSLAHAEGKDNAVSSKVLAENVGLKATTVRDLIPEIRRQYRLPIASSTKGYYKINSHTEFVEVMDRIENTIQTKKKHQTELAAAWNTTKQ
jgi:hypothetical protein